MVYSSTGEGTGRNFSLGQLTVQNTSALSPRSFVFVEVTFTSRPDAGTGTPAATGFNAEVERLFFRYDQSDQLKGSVGRYHTPINWWNTAFHHGLWLQTTIARPEMVRFGSQFIPVHFVGALVEGSFPANGLNLNYNVGLGNGRGNVFSRGGDAGDTNANLATLANVFVRPDRLYGLQVGASVYRDKATPAGGGPDVDETIWAAHLVYQKEDPEIIAEYAHATHDAEDGGPSARSEAYYVQFAYRLPGAGHLWKPYYRYEKIRVDEDDPILTATPGLSGNIVGVRYDATELAAIKLEYRDMKRDRGFASTSGVFAQVSFAF
uniref:FmdC n=1 Tax=uncultured Armatimonadetes bacterium TaxID=157466 RepID=A0A6J4H8C4_9BACT|nr:hypothetical protein AVDCRST_MAG63-147 [uncultured Armatimonadetes bacterium]